jgi:hypothetical protein
MAHKGGRFSSQPYVFARHRVPIQARAEQLAQTALTCERIFGARQQSTKEAGWHARR